MGAGDGDDIVAEESKDMWDRLHASRTGPIIIGREWYARSAKNLGFRDPAVVAAEQASMVRRPWPSC